MISGNCSIEEFVEAVKDKQDQDVIAAAVDEATQADRLVLRKHLHGGAQPADAGQYARQLKQLIGYHRYAVKPKIPQSKVYQLYTTHWWKP